MIAKVIRRLLKLDENDREIDRIHKNAHKKIEECSAVLKKAGEMDRKIMKKTTTFYVAKALGVLQ